MKITAMYSFCCWLFQIFHWIWTIFSLVQYYSVAWHFVCISLEDKPSFVFVLVAAAYCQFMDMLFPGEYNTGGISQMVVCETGHLIFGFRNS